MDTDNSVNSNLEFQEKLNDTTNLRGYILIWVGQLVSILGSGIVQFAIIWWLTEKTGSTFVLALATFVGLVPMVIIGPFSGVLADRWNRKKIMLTTDFLQAIATIGLMIMAANGRGTLPQTLIKRVAKKEIEYYGWYYFLELRNIGNNISLDANENIFHERCNKLK